MTWNPFDWTAGPFLSLYIALAAIIFLMGVRMRSSIGPENHFTHRLGVLELAYLAGGPRRVGDAVLVNLMAGGGATIAPGDYKIIVTNQTPLTGLMDRPPLLSVQPLMTRQQFQKAVRPLVERALGALTRNAADCPGFPTKPVMQRRRHACRCPSH